MGLYRSGFDVIGIDIKPQQRYPFTFIQGDALRPPVDLARFDFVWASPMCQRHSVGSRRWHKDWPCQLDPIRDMLTSWGGLYVIENVPGAPVRADLVLTGPMFGLKTQRRRHFECAGFWLMQAGLPFRNGPKTTPGFVTVAGNGGDGPNRISAFKEALGIDWMEKSELREAIPPAYSEFIGRAALRYINAKAA